ncbi:hypothetical protein [Vulcanisaeta thermophila]|uniref:hypothetical protein n=1 Tax=Vulcanisaeta thermophila TaxID=867917 RepID=UPI00117DA003|nr:hypothetical protein [Vulcanisaeta thermophila]
MARKTKNKNAGNPGQNASSNTNPVLICGIDQNKASIDLLFYLPRSLIDEVVNYVKEIRRTRVLGELYTIFTWPYGDNNAFIYLKVPLPEPLNKRYKRWRKVITSVVTTQLIKLGRRLRNTKNTPLIIGIERLTKIHMERKIDFLRYRQIYNLLAKPTTHINTIKIPIPIEEDGKIKYIMYDIEIRKENHDYYYIAETNPRWTSSLCGLDLWLHGKTTPATKLTHRLVRCGIDEVIDRDFNAAMVIAYITGLAYLAIKRYIANPARGGEGPWAPSPGPTHPGLGRRMMKAGNNNVPDVAVRYTASAA